LPDVTGKSPLRVEARQKVLKGSKKTAHNVKKSSTSVAVEQLSNVDVEKNFDKHYVADMFTDERVTELLSENTALKNKVELISVTFAVVHDKNSSISGAKMIPSPSDKAPQTPSHLPHPTTMRYSDF